MNKYYIEIDADKFEQSGEVEIVAPPKTWQEIFDDIFRMKMGSFGICRPDWLCNFVSTVGGQRGKVAAFLIQKKDSQNKILATNREIAAQTGVSLATVNATLRELHKGGYIKCRTAAIMLNPGVEHRGNRGREAYLLKLFEYFGGKAG